MNKIYFFVITFIIVFFGYGIYTNETKKAIKKEKRISCQKETVTFEKISNKQLIEKAKELFESGNYTIKSRIEQSIIMESKILDFISKEKADAILNQTIKKYIKSKNIQKEKLTIDYYISENDKEDKGKKSAKSKLFAGYLVFEFKLDKKLIYKIQTDYMKMDTSDIPERMDCVIKSFITLKGN